MVNKEMQVITKTNAMVTYLIFSNIQVNQLRDYMFQGKPEHLSQHLIGLQEKYSPQTGRLPRGICVINSYRSQEKYT
jgi:hypothetical protein